MMTNQKNHYDNQNQQQEQKQQQEHHEHYNYYNNNISAGTGRAPLLLPSDMEKIREAYCDNIGDLTGAVAKMIEKAIYHGLTAQEVVMAIEETGFAPRPSAYYLKAILENWAENGVTVSKIRHEVSANKGVKWWK